MSETRVDAGLSELTVAITRPRPQAERLGKLLREYGARTLIFPAIDIVPVEFRVRPRWVSEFADYHLAIFVSVNAVGFGVPLVLDHMPWPGHVQTIAVGQATRTALEAQAIPVGSAPPSANTEGLLRLPELQSEAVCGRCIALFRGVGGLDSLGKTLRQRGAKVTFCEVYTRIRTRLDPKALNLPGSHGEIDIMVVTSVDVLRSLVAIFDPLGAKWLRDTPLLVASERIADVGRALGWRAPLVVASGAGDTDVLAALGAWYRS